MFRSSGAQGVYIFFLGCGFKLDRINIKWGILLIDIINRKTKMIKPDCESVSFYNINSMFTVIIYGSWIIRDLDANIF